MKNVPGEENGHIEIILAEAVDEPIQPSALINRPHFRVPAHFRPFVAIEDVQHRRIGEKFMPSPEH